MMLKSAVRLILLCYLDIWTEGTLFQYPERVAFVERKIFMKINILPLYIKMLFFIACLIINIRFYSVRFHASHSLDQLSKTSLFNRLDSANIILMNKMFDFIKVFAVFYWLEMEHFEGHK